MAVGPRTAALPAAIVALGQSARRLTLPPRPFLASPPEPAAVRSGTSRSQLQPLRSEDGKYSELPVAPDAPAMLLLRRGCLAPRHVSRHAASEACPRARRALLRGPAPPAVRSRGAALSPGSFSCDR